MDMSNSVLLPSAQQRVWEALNDPAILKACIKGCESLEKTGDNAYKVAMTLAIGPVKAKFKGELEITDIVAPDSYTIRFAGQGGVAGFGKGNAQVSLTPEGTGTRLSYIVSAQVGGKIAQVGSRLIDGASKKMADDFFEAFRAALAEAAPPAGSEPMVASAGVVDGATRDGTASAPVGNTPVGAVILNDGTASTTLHHDSHRKLTWLAIAIAAGTAWLMLRQ